MSQATGTAWLRRAISEERLAQENETAPTTQAVSFERGELPAERINVGHDGWAVEAASAGGVTVQLSLLDGAT